MLLKIRICRSCFQISMLTVWLKESEVEEYSVWRNAGVSARVWSEPSRNNLKTLVGNRNGSIILQAKTTWRRFKWQCLLVGGAFGHHRAQPRNGILGRFGVSSPSTQTKHSAGRIEDAANSRGLRFYY